MLLAQLGALRRAVDAGQVRLVLGSSSPRRREALSALLGVADGTAPGARGSPADEAPLFTVLASTFDEKLPHSDYATPAEYCMATAREKAKDVCAKLEARDRAPEAPPTTEAAGGGKRRRRSPRTLVVAADTICAQGGRILEKPATPEDAAAMLRSLSGAHHECHTCVLLYEMPGATETFAFTTTTRVRFGDLSEEEIRAYVATGEPMDKAGAYGIQGKGRALVESVEGDFFNVVGFPARDFAVRFSDRLSEVLRAAEEDR